LQKEIKKILIFEKEILDYVSQMLKIKINAKRIRIHGDYHLKQILFTGKDFIIINFEGPASVPFSERRIKRSAFRDVASMIWSFHYAAYVASYSEDIKSKNEIARLEQSAQQWWFYIGNKFLTSYFNMVKDSDFLPKDQNEIEFLFHFYLLEKILNETTVCLANGSPWLNIPVKGLLYFKTYIESKSGRIINLD
jgi:maltose alpha-D-glucosyltransferase/alpha-amylase